MNRRCWIALLSRMLAVALSLALALCAAPLPAQEIEEGVGIGVERGVELYWSVATAPEDSWESLAARFLNSAADGPALQSVNRGGPQPGSLIKIPYPLLRPDEQRLTLLTLFPLDRNEGENWLHVVGQAEKIPHESLSGIALWLSGEPGNYTRIATLNPGTRDGIAPGQEVRVPADLLLPAFLTPAAQARLAQEIARRPPPPKPVPVLSPAPAPVYTPPPASAAASTPASSAASTSAPDQSASAARPVEPPVSAPVTAPAAAPTSATTAVPAPISVPNVLIAPLLPPLSQPVLPPPAGVDDGRETAPPDELRYGRDARGDFAVYALKPKEALYTSVVIRFMGLVEAKEVNQKALALAAQNRIIDVTQIPAGFGVKIRAADLLPQYAPPGSAVRLKYENRQRELRQAAASEPAPDAVELPGPGATSRGERLKGVTIILDAGHGGPDPGASYNGVWESDFVYDIFVRAKLALESTTAADVFAIVRDPLVGFQTRPLISQRSGQLEILTSPVFTARAGNAKAAVNHRARLITALARAAHARPGDAPVIFTSFHADALHPSVRGSMVYIPDADLSAPRGKRPNPPPKTPRGRDFSSRSERIKAEAFSGRLASTLVRTLRAEKIEIHPFNPVRSYVVRGGRPWVPAVIRETPLTYKLLVEVCNLANAEDARNLRDPVFRQRVAAAYVDALVRQFAPARSVKKGAGKK